MKASFESNSLLRTRPYTMLKLSAGNPTLCPEGNLFGICQWTCAIHPIHKFNLEAAYYFNENGKASCRTCV
jgi:hypothetical protein